MNVIEDYEMLTGGLNENLCCVHEVDLIWVSVEEKQLDGTLARCFDKYLITSASVQSCFRANCSRLERRQS